MAEIFGLQDELKATRKKIQKIKSNERYEASARAETLELRRIKGDISHKE
jgi:hypothetical protein